MKYPFEIEQQKIVYTNTIRPDNIPAIRDCKTKVTFHNTAPKPGSTILFAGCDFRNAEHGIRLENRKGVIVYKGSLFQYATTQTQ